MFIAVLYSLQMAMTWHGNGCIKYEILFVNFCQIPFATNSVTVYLCMNANCVWRLLSKNLMMTMMMTMMMMTMLSDSATNSPYASTSYRLIVPVIFPADFQHMWPSRWL